MAKNDYEVGYGKPPRHTRFKKGQSGNPKGRNKGTRNFATDVKEVLLKPVVVSEGDDQKTISTQMATLMRLREKALKGDVKAIDRLIALAQTHMTDVEPADREQPRSEADEAILERYITRLKTQTAKENQND